MKNFDVESPYYFCVVYQDLKIQSPSIILKTGEIVNQEEICNDYSFFDYFDDYYKDTYLYNYPTPFMVYTGIGQISQIENLILPNDVVTYINEHGLDIFFYENLFFDIGEKNTFSLKDTDAYNNPIINSVYIINGFESTIKNIENLHCFELDSVKKFVLKNGLTKVRVNTFDYNVEKYFKEKYSFEIKNRDIFKTSLLKHSTDSTTTYTYNPDSNIPDCSKIKYKFWSGAWRYTGYRHLLISYIKNLETKYSWQHNVSFEEINSNLWFDIDRWQNIYPELYKKIKNGVEELQNQGPIVMDYVFHRQECPSINELPISVYQSCFCAVVSETKFAQPTGMLSEKTLNAVKSFRPFILMAPPYSLEYAKKLGFKTFSDFWDESYDQEENHEQRLIKIFKVIDYLSSKSIEDLKVLYSEMTPIIEHNFKNLESLKKNSNFF